MKSEVFEARSDRRIIQVPSCWEEYQKDYEGVAFYLKSFKVPANWEGKVTHMEFDAVNYLSEVWLNDEPVGFHEGGFTPFSFRVDELINPGEENVVTLRVVGPIILTDKRIDGIGRQEVPMWRGGIAGGIWQSVRLKASGSTRIEDVFIEPKIETNTALYNLEIENTNLESISAEINLNIFSKEGKVVSKKTENTELLQGTNSLQLTMKIPDAEYWSMDNPYLYKAEIEIKTRGVASDNWETSFGMREFTLKGDRFVLNGKPMYLKAVFFEGLYPSKIAYPDSREMAIKEIELAKNAGFNMIRPWRKPPPPMWLDLCDSLGMMTVGSLVVECMNRPIPTPYLPDRVENELRRSILRDRNRTCVVLWELFNEISHGSIMNRMQHLIHNGTMANFIE